MSGPPVNIAPAQGSSSSTATEQAQPITDQELESHSSEVTLLPIANVGKIMRSALPGHAKLAKESTTCVQECVSEFISFVASEAADHSTAEKRKILNGEDVVWAMESLGFDHYSEVLRIYLARYRMSNKLGANESSRSEDVEAEHDEA